jgi:RNA recognition motif-containing protein
VGRKLYVGNLGYSVTQDDLKELFGQIGSCESIAIISDRETGQSKGFGFVEMSTDAEAQKAIQQLNSTDFKGRPLKVNEANERPSGGNRGGGGGGGRGRY